MGLRWLDVPCGLFPPHSIPFAPADLFKYHIITGATLFQRADNEPSRSRRGDSQETGNGSCQICHDMADGQGAVFKQNAWQVMPGQQDRSDGPGGAQIGQAIQTTADGWHMVRNVLGVGVIDSILQV